MVKKIKTEKKIDFYFYRMKNMSNGVNKVIILGRLGNDPDVRTMKNGVVVANISVATSEQWTDKQTGQNKENTEWHKVVFFGKLAEIVQQYLYKGSQVYIEGSLKTNKWTDKNGIERYQTLIAARELQILNSKQQEGQQGQPSQTIIQQTQPSQTATPIRQDYDEDLPF